MGFSLLILAVLCLVSSIQCRASFHEPRSFYIDFDQNTFVKDGKPFQYVSGTIHFYRVPPELWQDRLTKFRAAGLNTVQTYIFWNQHQPYPNVFDFDGPNDLFRFLNLAQNIGLNVILRAGPYACAERDYGGLPWWLLANGTKSILPRTNERNYMNAVKKWYDVFLPKVAPFLYKNGGPIITVQIENEYGSYFACDSNYTNALKDIFREYLGDDVVYFTTDGNDQGYLKCGVIKGVYPTIDFGAGTNVTRSFEQQRLYAPKGPLVNSEYYDGWLDLWGSPHSKVDTNSILKTFNDMQAFKANVNFYMFHGGTNYGFSNGADPPYLIQPTSYDFDAPISEAGDITDKYLAIRNTISKYFPLPPIPVPANSSKIAYGKVKMQYHVPLVDAILNMTTKCIYSSNPLSFEALGQGYGYVLYSADLSSFDLNNKVLSIPGIRDRGFIQIGNISAGLVYRLGATNITINLPKATNKMIFIVVENMGRLNYGNDMLDAKGILSDVTLDGQPVRNWQNCITDNFIPNYRRKLTDPGFVSFVSKYMTPANLLINKLEKKTVDFNLPAIYLGEFDAADDDCDTFLKMDKFTKGAALLQSKQTLSNLGRYWPNVGPQVTLYTPSVFVSKSVKNYIALIELENSSNCAAPDSCYVEFIDYPIIDSIKK